MIGSAESALAGGSRLSIFGNLRRSIPLAFKRADAIAALGLLASTLAFYYPLVFLGRVLVDYDALVYFVPQRVFLGRSLAAGRIPLWDPDLFMGAPFLANPQTAVLYPPSWLFAIGSAEVIYTTQLVLHAFLAAWFMYLFARHALGVLPLAAGVAGLAYALGGFAVGQVGHLNQISAAAWLPAVLLGYARFATTRQVQWIAAGAVALALQLLAGHPQETYMTLIVLGIFAAVTAPWLAPRRLVACALGGLSTCVIGATLSAAQLLPTLELTPLSIRGAGENWKDAVAGSLPTYLGIRALLPPYWISVPFTEYLGYVGVTTVTLAVIGLLGGRGRPVVFALLVSALGVLLALGENNALYSLAFETVPGFDTFRVPARWLLLWAFGASVLAAAGADWIGRGLPVRSRLRTVWLRAGLALGIVLFGAWWQIANGEAFPTRRTPLVYAALAAATVSLSALARLGKPNMALSLVVVLTAAELWAAAEASPARQAPPAAFSDGETVEWLRANGATDQQRLLSLARPEYVPAVEADVRAQLDSLPESIVDLVLVAQKYRDTLTPNVPLQYGLNTADGYDGGVLPLLRWLRLSGLLVTSPRPDGVLLTRLDALPSERALDLLGVRYVIANADTPPRANLEQVDFGDLKLYVRPGQVPLSLVVFGVTPVLDENAALDRLSATDFDPTRELVLEASVPARAVGKPAQPVVPDVSGPERWHASVSLSEPGYLLQREAWYPGWHARIDGVEAPFLRADGLFRAVAIGPGQHEVEIFFESSSFRRGVLLSGAGLVVIIVLLGVELIIRTRVRGR